MDRHERRAAQVRLGERPSASFAPDEPSTRTTTAGTCFDFPF
jgi:hypothetical protein